MPGPSADWLGPQPPTTELRWAPRGKLTLAAEHVSPQSPPDSSVRTWPSKLWVTKLGREVGVPSLECDSQQENKLEPH